MNERELQFATLAIHAAERPNEHQALEPPLYLSSTFTFNDVEQADDTFTFRRKAYVYTRGGNPTINLLEQRLAALEGGADAVAFASGMAAISTTLMSLAKTGDEIIAHRNLYGSTFSLTEQLLPKYGIKTLFIDMNDPKQLLNAINSKTKVIFFETPTNPSLEIIDIAHVVQVAKQHAIKVVVDNTFATPYLQNPLALGADIVIHSATKYLCGHGDAMGGLVTSKDLDYLHELKFSYLCELGSVMSPFNAWLILRGLKTLALRMQQHCANAKAIAEYLINHPKIARVYYPGLTSHPQYEIAKTQMRGLGGVVSFELTDDLEAAKTFMENLQLAEIAVSLGDAATLVQCPALMTHRGYPKEALSAFGFSEKTIRIAAGIEDTQDLLQDIERALNLI